jgi:uncharacterized protein (DUF1684 family)
MNKRLKIVFSFLFFCASIFSFAQHESAYEKEIAAWDAARIKSLKSENGWLNLVGLFWLKEGKNTFGSSTKNDVVFPEGTIAAKAGYFLRTGNVVKLVATKNAGIKVNGKMMEEAIIFNADSAKNPVLTCGDLKWIVIKREDKIGLRVRNIKSKAVAEFHGIERYPVDSLWKIEATLVVDTTKKTIAITNVIGQTTEQKIAGTLVFTINNKKYSLDALDDGDALFVIFGDATNYSETYPSGRFLDVALPDADGKTMIDFNKTYNPPCAFTDFATCPLPPKQNILPIAITAGEKKYGNH